MKFLCLVHFAFDAFDGSTPEDAKKLDDATIEHDRKLRNSGHLLIASPLTDSAEAVSLGRQRMAKLSATDGPYAEAKEVIGGFLLIEAQDMDEAVSLFDDDPILKYGRMEIRPLTVDHRHSETGEARPDFEPG